MWGELPSDILAELRDGEFVHRKHYSRATYALGCHGPLCRKAERDRGRMRNEARASEEGREYEPNHEFRVRDPKDIDDIISWHIEELAERRAAAQKAS